MGHTSLVVSGDSLLSVSKVLAELTNDSIYRAPHVTDTSEMGLFGRSKIVEENLVKVVYGSEFMSGLDRAKSVGATGVTISFPDELLGEIETAIRSHAGSMSVLYDEEMQFLDVVGESFHQDSISEIFGRFARNDDGTIGEWFSGFLLPEPLNPHDPNAVAVFLITESVEEPGFDVVQVGYLGREQAKKVQKKVIKFLNGGAIIPLLMKITGGVPDRPSFGVIARAKTKVFRF